VLAILALLPVIVAAQVVDPQNGLIRNMHIVEGGESAEPVLVSILVRNNILEIVVPTNFRSPALSTRAARGRGNRARAGRVLI
jgi:hypothetical protein